MPLWEKIKIENNVFFTEAELSNILFLSTYIIRMRQLRRKESLMGKKRWAELHKVCVLKSSKKHHYYQCLFKAMPAIPSIFPFNFFSYSFLHQHHAIPPNLYHNIWVLVPVKYSFYYLFAQWSFIGCLCRMECWYWFTRLWRNYWQFRVDNNHHSLSANFCNICNYMYSDSHAIQNSNNNNNNNCRPTNCLSY